MTKLERIKSFFGFLKHDWKYIGGEWVIENKGAITKRQCKRCGLYQETLQDHVYGMNTLWLSEIRPQMKAKYE